MSDDDRDYWEGVRAREAAEDHDETTAHDRVLAAHERHRESERLRERRRQDSSACRKGAHRACDPDLPCACSCHGELADPQPAPPKRVRRSGLSAVQRAEVAARKAAGEGTAALAAEFGVTTRRIRQIAHEGSFSEDEREQRQWERRRRDRQRDRRRRAVDARSEAALDRARGEDPPPRRTVYDALNEAEARLRVAERGTLEWTAASVDVQYWRDRVFKIEEVKRLEQVAHTAPPHGFDMFGNPIWW